MNRAIVVARDSARLESAAVKLYILSDRRDDQGLRGGATDRGIEAVTADHLREAAIPRHFALYLSTSHGEAIDLWDGFHRSFERRVLSGSNPYLLVRSKAEIVFVEVSSEYVRFYCRTRAPGTAETGRVLMAEVTELVGHNHRIQVIWDDNPWFFGELTFPPFLPMLGWAGPPPQEIRNPRYRCWQGGPDESMKCMGTFGH